MNIIVIKYTFVNLEILSLMTHSRMTMDESFHFFRRNFRFRWPTIRKRGAKCRRENFVKFRLKSAKIGCMRKISEIFKKIASAKFRFVSPIFLPIFREISRYFLPVQPAHRIQNLSNFFIKKK